MITQPDHAKASIREVYDIVSRLEDKLVLALHETEERIVTSIEDRDKIRRGDIARLAEDVDTLKAWKEKIEIADIASTSVREGKLWPIYSARSLVEEYWKVMLVVLAIAAFMINDLRIDIR